MTTKPVLNLHLVELKTSNIALAEVIAGLTKFKKDLEAKGVEVSITVEDQWHTGPTITLLNTESEPMK